MKTLLIAIFAAISVFGQTAPEYVQSSDSPNTPITTRNYRDGSNNLEYQCKAVSTQPTFTWSRSDSTLTSIAVATNVGTATTSTAHGLAVGNRVSVRGATVDAELNGDYVVATVGSTTTFTFTTASVADATYTDATMALYTTAPRGTANVWSIVKSYWTTTYQDRQSPAEGSLAHNKACDSRATYAYN